jgi:hypothetical protein
VRVVAADGDITDVPTCARPGENPEARARVEASGPDVSRTPPAVPVFVGAAEQGLYANPDNAYLATLVAAAPGRIVVLRGHAPRTPDAEHGRPIGGDEQVRYWSVCTNEWRRPYPVTACLADDAIRLDDSGRYTIVIATVADRPTTLARHPEVVTLDWGATDVPLLVLVRQMRPAGDYAAAAARVEPGAPALTTMGADAPVAVLCTRAVFDARGPDACR